MKMSEKLTLKFLEKCKILLVLFITYDDYIHTYIPNFVL